MDSGAVSAGVFTLRDKAYINSMPVHNASGFWQAWRMQDGLFMVQPLDQDHVPWGTMYLLEPREFSHLLLPFDPQAGSGESPQGAGRIDGADFLAVWYEQALAEQERLEPGGEDGPARDEPRAGGLSATPAKAPVSSDETVLMPLWHPDEIFADQGGATREVRAGAGRGVPGNSQGRAGNGAAQAARAAGPSRGGARAGRPVANPAKAASLPEPDDDLFSDIVTPEALSGPRPLDFLPPLSLEDTPEPEFSRAGAAAQQRRPEAAAGQPRPGAAAERPRPGAEMERPRAGAAEERPRAALAGAPPQTPPSAPPRAYGPGVTVEPVRADAPGGGAEFRDDDNYVQERAARLERSMREEFSSLVKLLEKGVSPELERAFSRLVQRGAGFTSQQKFMFSEFGLTLRRQHMQKLALQCHLRALELAPSDEHVLFNVARSKYELGDNDSAVMYLTRALATAPDFAAARNFLSFLEGSAKTGY